MSTKKESGKASTTKEVNKKTSAQEKADVFIYVGPTTKQLTRYASFTGGLPVHMKEHFEECPVLKKLFIPTSEFSGFEQRVTDSSSVESMLFNKVKNYFEGVNS
ncbi:hypothetical protein OXB_2978 [Bacillus sp. OxB-1]|uniref:hypothetical protein n=1 Tax=Bacillus sp. (strain OxB-1) TaxID=98228 RepID=UPI0005820702|nr:hypothetical protein [Bacillus sp. OxB-1]BAQ11448.1 hypothetical protein OXB_2978 [Bacillus sp. OxB-1]